MAKRKATAEKQQFTVRMRCTITKLVTCEGCTEQEARERPYDFAVDEREVEQIDYEVTDVKLDGG